MNEMVTSNQKPALQAGAGKISPIVPRDFEQVWRLATMLAASDMVPKTYVRRPEATAAAIMHGMEVGLTPMAALQSIAVINGTPSVWGDGAIALVRGSGLCEGIKEWIEGEGDRAVAYCEVRRKGEADPIKRSFSMGDARKAGLAGKQNTPWQTYPRRMLQMRARSWALRDGFADVLRGLRIAEEVQDYQEYDLRQAPDGTYEAAPKAPPAPKRADYEAQEPQEPQERAEPEAEVADEAPSDRASEVIEALHGCQSAEQLFALWQDMRQQGTLEEIAEADPDAYQRVSDVYDGRSAVLDLFERGFEEEERAEEEDGPAVSDETKAKFLAECERKIATEKSLEDLRHLWAGLQEQFDAFDLTDGERQALLDRSRERKGELMAKEKGA